MNCSISIDDSLGNIRNYACEKITLSEAIIDYTTKMEKINLMDCPPAFEAAFKPHPKACEAFLSLSNKYPDLCGEIHNLFDQRGKTKDSVQFQKQSRQIWDTSAGIEIQLKLKK